MTETPPPPETARLFLALWPTPRVRAELVGWQDAYRWPGTSSVIAPGRLHLTLHFIGAVPRIRIDALMSCLSVPAEAFELQFGQPEIWPSGIAVLEPIARPEGLLRLHVRLADALSRCSLPTDSRPFRPHVTLARRAHGAARFGQAPSLRWRPQGYALVESQRALEGGYAVLRRFALGLACPHARRCC
jgi:2'-5' RNA ligase